MAPPPTLISQSAAAFEQSSRVGVVIRRWGFCSNFLTNNRHVAVTRRILWPFDLLLRQVSDPSAIQRLPARLMRDPVSTLPKPRSLLGETQGYSQNKSQLRTSLLGPIRPASAHGAGGERGGGGGGERGGGSSLSSSPRHCALDLGFPITAEVSFTCWFPHF